MSWQLLIIIHTFLGAANVLFKRDLAKYKLAATSPFVVTAIASSTACVVGLLLGISLGHVQTELLMPYLLRFMLGGVFFALSSCCIYLTFVYLDSVVASLLNTLTVFTTIFVAWLTLHESLTAGQFIGGAIVMPAICYVLYLARKGDAKQKKNQWAAGIGFAVVAAIIFSLALTNEKYLVSHMSVSTYMVYGWSFQALMAVLIASLRPREWKLLRKPKLMRKAVWTGLTAVAAGSFFIMAESAHGNVGLLSMVSNCRVLLIALLAGVTLGERQDYWQRVGAASVVIVGLSFIFW